MRRAAVRLGFPLTAGYAATAARSSDDRRDYKVEQTPLGEGAFGAVYRAEPRAGTKIVA